MRLDIERRMQIGLGMVTALILAVALVGARVANLRREKALWVSHSRDVLTQIEHVRYDVTKMEEGKFRFLITGDPRFLTARQANIEEMLGDVTSLQWLTRDNTAQQANISLLKRRIEERLALSRDNIARRQRGDLATVRANIESGRGQHASGRIEDALQTIQTEENRLLGQRQRAEIEQIQLAGLIFYGLTVGIVILLVVVYASVLRANRARQAAQDGLHNTLESMDQCFFTLDGDWIFTYVNAAAEQTLRLKRDELLGRNLLEAYPDITDTLVHQKYKQAIATGENVSFENFYPTHNAWYEITACPTESGLAVYFRDTTERVQVREITEAAQQAQSLATERMVEAQRIARLGHWEADLVTGVNHWADETFRLFGLEPTSVTPGLDEFLQWVHPEDRDRLSQAIQTAIMHGTCYRLEYRILRAEGGLGWVHAAGETTQRDDGTVVGLRGTLHDITARKVVEQQIRDNNERQAAIITLQQEIADAEQDYEQVLNLIVERTQTLTKAQGSVIEFLEETLHEDGTPRQEMVYRAVSGMAEPYLGLRIAAQGSLSGRCIRERALLCCEDTDTDARIDRAACRKVGVRSMILVPLSCKSDTLAVLKVMFTQPAAFTDQDVTTLQLITGVIGTALYGALAFRTQQEILAVRSQAIQTVQESETRLRAASNASMDAFFLLTSVRDGEGQITDFVFIDINTQGEWMVNMPRERVVGQKLCELLPVNRTGGFFDKYVRVVEGRQVLEEEFSIQDEHFEASWLRHQVVPVGDGVAITSRDVTEQRQMQDTMEMLLVQANDARAALEEQTEELTRANIRLETLATTDGLTGLKNHRTFQERLVEEWERSTRHARPLSVILLDVDKFKQFNDTFGHPAGDRVLKKVGEIVHAEARASDMAARYGGEEFVLLLPETDAQGAKVVAERVRQALLSAHWEQRDITASFGVSTWKPLTPNPGELVTQADTALYGSKRDGRNRVTHHDDLLAVSNALPDPPETQAVCATVVG